ncbi:helix-turn-helix transcriptional regulator [Niveispirillum sp. KHB5.9]|uniref:helix-turn-helix transcriptional regulator n=1 Tax=Niveispirillum sp. KHB5.9 TaxID=3400269 RepID=UPI003A84F4CE
MVPFTNHVRRLRFEAGEMTQIELAERIGVTRQTIAAIEQGKYSPSLEAAFRIAQVFKVPLESVFQWQGDSANAE